MSSKTPVEDTLGDRTLRDFASPEQVPPLLAATAGRSRGAGWRQAVIGLWKYFVGVLACQNAVLCLFANGWTYRVVQRAVLKRWWKLSLRRENGVSFAQCLQRAGLQRAGQAGSPETDQTGDVLTGDVLKGHQKWPNWIVGQDFLPTVRDRQHAQGWGVRRLRVVSGALCRSLWLNFKLGVQGIFNTWVLTLPGCALWATAWFGGWNNSFHKGYEMAAFGPLTGLLGVALFIVAMLYLPVAQARQAATGEWRAFYQFGLIRTLVRYRWRSCFLLAGLYSLVSFPLTIFLVLPAFFPQIWPDLAALSDAEALAFLSTYYFQISLAAFPLFVLLRLAAGRVYATAIVATIRRGVVNSGDLAPVERHALSSMGLTERDPQQQRNILVRAVGWTGSRAGRAVALALVLSIWFSFVAQIFIGQFFFYRPYRGWLNQPLVQLPYFPYIPEHLRVAAEEEVAGSGAEEE